VLKPSEYATFAVLRLAALIEEAGLPAGVLNVVTGPGEPTGDALISHPMVDKLSFTGSRAVGQRIMMAAAVGCTGSASSSAARARPSSSPTPTSAPPPQ
jgi:aldehyde dehydrogenase (NAD+)